MQDTMTTPKECDNEALIYARSFDYHTRDYIPGTNGPWALTGAAGPRNGDLDLVYTSPCGETIVLRGFVAARIEALAPGGRR